MNKDTLDQWRYQWSRGATAEIVKLQSKSFTFTFMAGTDKEKVVPHTEFFDFFESFKDQAEAAGGPPNGSTEFMTFRNIILTQIGDTTVEIAGWQVPGGLQTAPMLWGPGTMSWYGLGSLCNYNTFRSCIVTQDTFTLLCIATTQYSPELNKLDWGGSIIAKINHHTTPSHTTPCDYFFDQNRQVWSNVVQFRVEQ